MDWLSRSYVARYYRADSQTFEPFIIDNGRAIRLTPENISRFQPSASAHFVKRITTAPVYSYANENDKLVAMSGIGFLTEKSFAVCYTKTDVEYRDRG